MTELFCAGSAQEKDMVLPSETAVDNSLQNSFEPKQNSTMILATPNETETNSHVDKHQFDTLSEASVEMISPFEYVEEDESNQTDEMPTENPVELQPPREQKASKFIAMIESFKAKQNKAK